MFITDKNVSIEVHRDARQCFSSKRDWILGTRITGFKTTGEWRAPRKGEWFLSHNNSPILRSENPIELRISILLVEGEVWGFGGYLILEPVYAG